MTLDQARYLQADIGRQLCIELRKAIAVGRIHPLDLPAIAALVKAHEDADQAPVEIVQPRPVLALTAPLGAHA